MHVDCGGDKDLRELNNRLSNDTKRVNGVLAAEQNLVEDGILKLNGVAENVKDGHGGAVQAPAALQMPQQQQQSQGAMFCWERFLHLRSLKVLLVENDDSTRHVVTALLRNCSYEVIEAANALQAWKVLEDLTNHIDLVLTEVVMPYLSGIGLLCKIMSHKTRKNVPVIMMSSHDSMGLVFKCLSKGAVDFLVKPIRKNELKNLWQHVWRRCHSSSGSGSESGTQTQKSVKSKSVEKSDNNTGSNDEDDHGSIGLNAWDGSDNESGTQSSWTKQAVEVDSPRPVSPWDQVGECPDSTCAQVIHSNAEISSNKHVPMTTTKKCQQKEEQLGNVAIGKDLEIGVPRNLNLQLEYPVEDPIQLVGAMQNNLLERGSGRFGEKIDKGLLDLNTESPSSRLNNEAVNLTSITINTVDPHTDSTKFGVPNRHSMISDIKNKSISDAKGTPSFEFTLKRLRGVEDAGTTVQDDRNVLRRSDSSAFLRYNTTSNPNKATGGKTKSDSPCDTSMDVTKKGSDGDLQSHSNGGHPNQCSNVGSSNIDMGSTTNNMSNRSVALKNKTAVTTAVKCLHPLSAFQLVKGEMLSTPQQIVLEKTDDTAGNTILAQPGDTHQELLIKHLSHCYDHHQHLHNMQKCRPRQLPSDSDESSLKKMAAAGPHCGSSNVLDGPVEGNAGNCSVNGSAFGSNHGSNHGSNGQNGSSAAVNAGETNMEDDNGITGKSGIGDASGSGNGNRADQNKSALREADLTKFQQLREERSFRKKVRCQSRKRQAEQRLRVRGQFVWQGAEENTSRARES